MTPIRGEERDGALEPKLSAFDKRVLAALTDKPQSAWRIAEALSHDDVREIRAVLRGLCHLGRARSVGYEPRRQRFMTKEGWDRLTPEAIREAREAGTW